MALTHRIGRMSREHRPQPAVGGPSAGQFERWTAALAVETAPNLKVSTELGAIHFSLICAGARALFFYCRPLREIRALASRWVSTPVRMQEIVISAPNA